MGLNTWQMRALEVCSPGGVLQLRLGLISVGADRRGLFGGRIAGPAAGSGWLTVSARVDVFAVSVRVWRDDGEASYMS
jgi:hypothetical protein